MKIDLNFTVKNLDGTDRMIAERRGDIEIVTDKPFVASERISHFLFYMPHKQSAKVSYWAEKLFKGEVLELDPDDVKILKDAIVSFKFAAGIEAQILAKIKE